MNKRRKKNIILRAYNKLNKEGKNINNISYQKYKAQVVGLVNSGYFTKREAIKTVSNTENFVSAAERARTNLKAGIKEKYGTEAAEFIRRRNKDKSGKFAGSSGFKWNKDRKGYEFGNGYFIDFTNSPEELNIYDNLGVKIATFGALNEDR